MMFRFTIRDVLWLTVVGMGIALFMASATLQEEREERELQEQLVEQKNEAIFKSCEAIKRAWKREAELPMELEELRGGTPLIQKASPDEI